MTIDFCLPVKNEGKILKNNVKILENFLLSHDYGLDWNIIIIVNGSNNNFINIAKSLKNDHIKVIIISSSGKSLAIKTAFQRSSADLVFMLDADLAVSLEYITKLLEPIKNDQADLVMGSRLMRGSSVQRPFIRTVISKIYNHLSRIILRHHYNDLQCGFKVLRREVFQSVEPYLYDNQWFLDTELVLSASCLGFKIKEIPVDWEERRYDMRKSKVKIFRDSIFFLFNMLRFRKTIKQIKKTLK